jgi:hypothetical protein
VFALAGTFTGTASKRLLREPLRHFRDLIKRTLAVCNTVARISRVLQVRTAGSRIEPATASFGLKTFERRVSMSGAIRTGATYPPRAILEHMDRRPP